MFQSKNCIEKAYEKKINKNLKTQTEVVPSAIDRMACIIKSQLNMNMKAWLCTRHELLP